MVLTYVDFLLFAVLLVYAFAVRLRVADSAFGSLIFYYILCAGFVALGIGGAANAAISRAPGIALVFARIAASATMASHMIIALFSITFPYQRQYRLLFRLTILVWAIASLLIFFTDWYLVSFTYVAGSLMRELGPLYLPFTIGGFILGIASVLALLARRSFFTSKIYRLQTSVIVAGVLLGYTASFALAIVFPLYFDLSWTYILMPLGAGFLSLSLGYGISITRIFDVTTVASVGFRSLLHAGLVGLAAGAVYVLGDMLFGRGAAILSLIPASAAFGTAYFCGAFLRKRFGNAFRSTRAYADRLESALASLDYAQGRDRVIADVLRILRESMDCGAIHLVVENAQGALVQIGSTLEMPLDASIAVLDRRNPGIEKLVEEKATILLKTEIIANYDYHGVKEALLDVLERFDADAMILVLEDRTLIGGLLLGSKSTGGDFTDYDYQALRRVYGKLFVALYYLKHIAQESLVTVVDRELEYSEQIIQSIQENIDAVHYPGIDISYLTRSTRKLGGDFIDMVKLSEDRCILVLGDVAGKGLNASLSMVILKSVIRTFLRETKDFKTMIVKVNAFIKANLPRGTFFAGLFGYFDLKNRTLFYVNCGVPALFLLPGSETASREIQGPGKVLGFVKDIAPHINLKKAVFEPGDIILMTTDGLTDAESPRGERYGKDRIHAFLVENRAVPAERMVKYLSEEVSQFVAQELGDDISIIAIKFNA